jgi:hypothetical protein
MQTRMNRLRIPEHSQFHSQRIQNKLSPRLESRLMDTHSTLPPPVSTPLRVTFIETRIYPQCLEARTLQRSKRNYLACGIPRPKLMYAASYMYTFLMGISLNPPRYPRTYFLPPQKKRLQEVPNVSSVGLSAYITQ